MQVLRIFYVYNNLQARLEEDQGKKKLQTQSSGEEKKIMTM